MHGPHQGAQKSTSTGTFLDAAITSCSKVSSVVSIMFLAKKNWLSGYQMEGDLA
ncbi:unnamed protein product [Mycetohabitans rhizoxinica HKI 454]|uniref:Uncharacterized protein n=1 Tax=Mycetohabitans rhizoxinica (strain DSM 19002 / CIP 109453 / HKI 454) TaxID=882378 RepID=E5AP66_MYCRK|nr:unnamed protein product [Mycetohabitans rhizoxinica HKI 454]